MQQLVYTAQDALDTDAPVTLTVGGEPVRGVWGRRFDWPVAADPNVLADDAAENAPRVVDLPTSSWQYGNPEGPRTYPMWPEDYSATLAPDGRLEVWLVQQELPPRPGR